jgi:hypothetical protein
VQAGDEQLGQPRVVDHVRPLDPRDEVLPAGRPAEAVEADAAEHDRQEGDRARRRVAHGEGGERDPQPQAAVTHAPGRDQREEAEEDGKRLAVPRPRLAAERRHPEQRDVRVEADREREDAGVGRVGVGELERGEEEEQCRAGPPAPVRRVLGERPRFAARALARPYIGIRECPPGAQRPPHVPQEDGEQRNTEPEVDVDPRRRQVAERIGVPHRRGGEDEHEQRDRNSLQCYPQRRRERNPRERLGRRSPLRAGGEQRPLPERAERDERDNEYDGRPPEEQPFRDGQVADAADPVGDDHGSTWRFPSRMSDSCSSISKRPGTFARNTILVRPSRRGCSRS